MGKICKSITYLIALLLVSSPLGAADTKAKRIRIIDSGGYYTGTEVETALQEIGAGTTTDPYYWRLDGVGGPPTANWDMGGYDFTTMGNITGTDVDISAGTGDYSSTGNITLGSSTTGLIDLSSAQSGGATGLTTVLKLSTKTGAATELGTAIGSGFNKSDGREFFNLWGGTANTSIFSGGVADDNYRRFRIRATGELNWGSGTAALDISLYRYLANQLKTDDRFIAAALEVDTLDLNNNVISDSTGTISFDDENITTMGDVRIVSDSSQLEIGNISGGDLTLSYDGANGYIKTLNDGADIRLMAIGDCVIQRNADSHSILYITSGVGTNNAAGFYLSLDGNSPGTADNSAYGMLASVLYDTLHEFIDDSVGNHKVFTLLSNRNADHDHAQTTNPTQFIHSATNPNTDNTQWLSLEHTTTTGLIKSGKGEISFDDENLTTTGLGTLGSLVVDGTTLVANASGYEDKLGVGTATPLATAHLSANTQTAMYFTEVGNGVTYGFGALGGFFKINSLASLHGGSDLSFMKMGLDIEVNPSKANIDTIFYGNTAEIARFDADTDRFGFPNDKALTFGGTVVSPAVQIDYDSGNGWLDIDLTNGADFNITTTGNANAFFVEESTGFIGIGDSTPNAVLRVSGTPPSGTSVGASMNFPIAEGATTATVLAATTLLSDASTTSFLGLNFNANLEDSVTHSHTLINSSKTNINIRGQGTSSATTVVGNHSRIRYASETASTEFDTTDLNLYQAELHMNGVGPTYVFDVENYKGFYSTFTEGAGGTIEINDLRHFALEDFNFSTATKDIVDQYGLYIPALTAATNNYGIWIAETTGTIANEIFLDGGGEIFFRDPQIHLGSLTNGHLDLTADVTIDQNAGQIHKITEYTASNAYTALASDYHISIQYTDTGTFTLTLPAIGATNHGQAYHLKDADYNAFTNNITVAITGADTIDEEATQTISSNGTCLTVVANDTTNNWEVQ